MTSIIDRLMGIEDEGDAQNDPPTKKPSSEIVLAEDDITEYKLGSTESAEDSVSPPDDDTRDDGALIDSQPASLSEEERFFRTTEKENACESLARPLPITPKETGLMPSNFHTCVIHGNDIQLLEILLPPGGSIIAEKRGFCFGDEHIEVRTTIADGTEKTEGIFGKVVSGVKRKMAGETFFLQELVNTGECIESVGISAPFPGEIKQIELDEQLSEVFLTRGAMLAMTSGIHVTFKILESPSAMFFGGEGLALQALRGKGTAYFHAGGSIVERIINDSVVNVDTGSLVGFTGGLKYSAKPSGKLSTMAFSGEGIFLSSLRGTGKVWIQSQPFNRYVKGIYERMKDKIADDIKNSTKH